MIIDKNSTFSVDIETITYDKEDNEKNFNYHVYNMNSEEVQNLIDYFEKFNKNTVIRTDTYEGKLRSINITKRYTALDGSYTLKTIGCYLKED